MMKRFVMLSLFFVGGTASAQDMGAGPAGDFEVEAGLRYFASTGKSDFELYDDETPTRKVSSIQYEDDSANTAEAYFRADHRSGAFIKGISGIGKIRGGTGFDEDFPPLNDPYSKTQSDAKGHLKYVAFDVGYNFFDTSRLDSETPVRLGAFVGYGYWNQKFKAMGCTQVGGKGSDICTPPDDFGTKVHVLTEADWFRGARLGMTGDVQITPKLKVTAEAAYLFTHHKTLDQHPLRTDLADEYAKGDGEGHQLEMVVSYDIAPRITLGAGARWWHVGSRVMLESDQLETFKVNRYGAFLQVGFKL